MRTPLFRPLTLGLLAALALPIAGCATNRNRGDLPYVARDVGTLYTAAKKRLDQGRYKEAAALFDEVERQHPYSVWARRAQLMGAFSYYLNRDYTQAIQGAQRFLSVHPGNRDAPYAYYLVALSYYEQISDVSRDQKITSQAQDALGELMRRYPTTRYAADARLKLDLVRDHLAGKEMEIGRFYERRRQWLSATLRFRRVVDQYQTTTHTPEALMRLTETYLALGVRGEAEKAAAVLGANYPGSDWYARAYKLMQEYPAKPIAPLAPGELVVPQPVRAATPGEAATPTPSADAPAPTTPATTGGDTSPGSTAPGAGTATPPSPSQP
ncbi:outer membrane protein assembly factor BamD [Sphingomonas ginsenosidimutans]|jgi:outer membrane protein assembly factor BamD|uniref:Outer membrane protein assembly factor BamD n=4 Tax=Sphingomonas TaxID=13687 RepID=A0A2A4HZM4_9SPHN|nr:outer membrane protein assembly factor BamD [Sphingomonas ginsenosidimutans]PCG10322.1 outer membrane protein assembly factor BamD [Sphingomonas ginsenosidimutans]